jgi:hypothetical protein
LKHIEKQRNTSKHIETILIHTQEHQRNTEDFDVFSMFLGPEPQENRIKYRSKKRIETKKRNIEETSKASQPDPEPKPTDI